MLARIASLPPVIRWVGMAVAAIGLTMVLELEIDIGGCDMTRSATVHSMQSVECTSCHGFRWGGSW